MSCFDQTDNTSIDASRVSKLVVADWTALEHFGQYGLNK